MKVLTKANVLIRMMTVIEQQRAAAADGGAGSVIHKLVALLLQLYAEAETLPDGDKFWRYDTYTGGARAYFRLLASRGPRVAYGFPALEDRTTSLIHNLL